MSIVTSINDIRMTLNGTFFVAIFSEKFGLYAVNFTSPRKERIPKKSTKFMRTVATTHQIPTIN